MYAITLLYSHLIASRDQVRSGKIDRILPRLESEREAHQQGWVSKGVESIGSVSQHS